ncbi:membrane-associating domain-containing protein [Pochonia chlamydosporia 170]|uniref:Membrane-associating domain-containing protein n=1 Tax=Pochonia chlamydosporia 170 TaxID=1380566 RepID=A0A179FPB8_METCM|nr:membrane-associating domain-containing protein [Pochonia chlamydosporia 170]OAQ66849.1 membrane-associating domain-containing protein [Pochonia chlamydosporia 170]
MVLQRKPGREHIPNYPPGWVTIRYLQLFLAIAILGLSAYTIYATRAAAATNGLGLFSALVTVIISIWLICAHTCSPGAYNYWANLFWDLYLYIFWLTTFSLAAVWAGLIFAADSIYHTKRKSYSFCDNYFDNYDDVGYYNKYCKGNGGYFYGVDYKVFGGVVAGIAGLGAIEFLLFFIAWVTDAVVIYRHRRDGGHARKGRAIAGSAAAPYQVQMQPQVKSDYHAVPQQGIPFTQQETAYHPQGMYNPPQQQPFYPPTQPIAPQHTGNTFVQTHTPPPGGYPAPQYPPQQPAAPYHPNY